MWGRSSRRTERVVALAALLSLSGVACDRSRAAGSQDRKGEPVRVAAASDLALAFKEVGDAFEKSTSKKVEFTFGSTGSLSKQIAEGAPYDVFAAANVSYVDEVVKASACLVDTKKVHARGRIVMWSKDKATLPKSLEELKDPKYAKVAIANPDHAPYGVAAQEALTKSGVWATVQPRTVFGENVQQAQMFAKSGNAEVAIIALSLALSSGGSYELIDANLHAPLDQALVVCKGGAAGGKTNEARAFVDFVTSDAGHAIMRRYGFLLPGEALPPPP
jgi:molybdate transport system substrate-binding protein